MSGQLAPGVLLGCFATIMQIQSAVLWEYYNLLLDYDCRTMGWIHFVSISGVVLTVYKFSVSCLFINLRYWHCFRFIMRCIPMAIYLARKPVFVCIYNSGNVASQNGALCLLLWPLPRPQDDSPRWGWSYRAENAQIRKCQPLGGWGPVTAFWLK